ncbi:MAG: hypothetical protein F4139_09020 [Gemmatimonadetes bacterium]|nr:hypothetical protein [Gemmatimonadota bacterium]MYH53080.1 hypothetical protein [Gemmatimonadota bacterium]MYK65733.1 hypothetical protein [Gemmatimonadota bacterium]
MTKADLVEQVAEAVGSGVTKKDCGLVVDAFLVAEQASKPMEWTPPPDGIAICQDGTERL